MLALSGTGEQVKVQGGGDMELGLPEAEVVTLEKDHRKARYEMDNGRTFLSTGYCRTLSSRSIIR